MTRILDCTNHILDYSAPTFVALCGAELGLMVSRVVFDHLPGTAATCDACRVIDEAIRIVERADHPAGGSTSPPSDGGGS